MSLFLLLKHWTIDLTACSLWFVGIKADTVMVLKLPDTRVVGVYPTVAPGADKFDGLRCNSELSSH